MIKITLICAAALLLATACKKTTLDTSASKDVYVLGEDSATVKLWKNGVDTSLTDGTFPTQGNAVFVSASGDVYAVGGNLYGVPKPRLWKNNVASDMFSPASSNFTVDYGVFISGTDVYVAGWDGGHAAVWKNGVATQLPADGSAGATSVYVSGGDVYVVGWTIPPSPNSLSLNPMAMFWKNGVSVKPAISAGVSRTEAVSIFVNGTDVYVTGYDLNQAVIWKNGVETILPNIDKDSQVSGSGFARGNSIYVVGSDVYVAGSATTSSNTTQAYAVLWKNGVGVNLTDGTIGSGNKKLPSANSVFVSGSDVYVAGRDNKTAILWKNGIGTKLNGTSANSVFVK